MPNSAGAKKRSLVTGGVLAAISGIAIGAWGVSAVANASDRDSIPDNFAVVTTSAERLPADVALPDLGVGGLAGDSIQALGELKNHSFYLAVDSVNNICVVAYDTTTKASASSCSPPGNLEKAPLGVGLWTIETGGVEAYLLPDDYSVLKLPAGWNQVSPNIIAISMETATKEDAVIKSGLGESISLSRLDSPDAVTGEPAE